MEPLAHQGEAAAQRVGRAVVRKAAMVKDKTVPRFDVGIRCGHVGQAAITERLDLRLVKIGDAVAEDEIDIALDIGVVKEAARAAADLRRLQVQRVLETDQADVLEPRFVGAVHLQCQGLMVNIVDVGERLGARVAGVLVVAVLKGQVARLEAVTLHPDGGGAEGADLRAVLDAGVHRQRTRRGLGELRAMQRAVLGAGIRCVEFGGDSGRCGVLAFAVHGDRRGAGRNVDQLAVDAGLQ